MDGRNIVYVVMWQKFVNSSISITEFIVTSILKSTFLKECSWFKFNNIGLTLGMALKFDTR